ncbi:MAG TPA: energy transducer TonB [Gemmatimonadales bacterium]|jgi:TonB family protein
MNLSRRLVLLAAAIPGLALGVALKAAAAEAKAGYTVVLEISVDDKGAAQDAKVFKTEDQSGEHILEQVAMEQAHAQKFEVRKKDGKAVAYTARVPYFFPVAGDEGAESNLAPRPHLHGPSQVQPVYPPELAAKGETGAAIIEVTFADDGAVKYTNVLRATRQEFADAAVAAVKQWHFTPAMRDGEAVSSRWRMAIVFRTEVSQPDWEWTVPPRPSLGTYSALHIMNPAAKPAAAPANPPAPAPGK